MKFSRIFLTLTVAAAFTACSNKTEWDIDGDMNTTDALVGFESATVVYNESDGLVKLPIKVTGERNGNVKINVKATDGTAVQEEHYIVTSGDLNIPAEEEVSIELRLLDDGQEENEDREFTLTITSAEGAKVSEIGTCTVTLKDVDANPFFKLFGTYEAEAFDLEGNPCNFTVTIDDEAEATEQYLYAAGQPESFYGFDTKWILAYSDDGTLTFEYGYWDGLYNFGSFTGVVTMQPFFYDEENERWVPAESASATYNDTYDTITFEEGMAVGTGVYKYENSQVTSYAGRYDGPVYVTKFTKVPATPAE